MGVHLGYLAEIATLRGPKKRAKTDRADAQLLRTLVLEGRFPESWIPPAHVVETRILGRLYCRLMDERRSWQQRIHAQLFQQGCPPITALLCEAGRDGLARVELSAAGRHYVDAALRRIDDLTGEIVPLRAQLVGVAHRQAGCRALQASQYGVGWLSAAIMWAEIGDARRFRNSGQLVRFAGVDITVYSSADHRAGGHLSRQGSPELRWAAFEAAKCAARPASPDYAYYRQVAARKDGKRPTLAVERKGAAPLLSHAARARRCRPGRARPHRPGSLTQEIGVPFAHEPIDARGRLPQQPCCHLLAGEHLSELAAATLSPGTPHAGHPIGHHVAGHLVRGPR